MYRFYPYLWISMLLFLVFVLLIVFAWKRRSEKGVLYFLFTLILSTVWIIAQAMEISSIGLPAKIFWANIVYIPSSMIPVTYFYLSVHFMHRDHWLKKCWLQILILIMPVSLNLLLWTNDYHGLIRQNIKLDTSNTIPVISKSYGPFFWAYVAYNLVLTVFTLYILLKGIFEYNNKLQRAQVFTLFMGLLIPTCSVLIFISKTTSMRVDPTPIAIGISGILISLGILRYQLFDIISIAHSTIIKEMIAGMIILDNEGRVLEMNPAARDMLSITMKKPNENRIVSLFETYPELIEIYNSRTDRMEEIALENQKGKNYYEVSFKQLSNCNNIPFGWIFLINDVTQRRTEEEKIRSMATHDALTGLINRPCFETIFTDALEKAKKSSTSFAIAYMDLDDFKLINDTYGHDAGDGFLREFADKFQALLKEKGLISRYGGDEFAVLLPEIDSKVILNQIFETICEELVNGIEYTNTHIPIKASIGYSIYPEDGDNLELLIKKADERMYEIKRSKKCDISVN